MQNFQSVIYVLDVLISFCVKLTSCTSLNQISISVSCDSTSSGTLQWTQTAPEDPEHVALAGLDDSHRSAPRGGQPPALPVPSHSEPADPVTAPSTAATSSLSASAAVSNSLPLVHTLVSPSALYCPQPNSRVPPARSASPASADAAPTDTHSSSASASATAGLSARPLPTRHAPDVAVTQASSRTTRTAPVYRFSCQHFCHSCRQSPGSHPGPDSRAAAPPANNRSANTDLVRHRPALTSAETTAG